MFTNFVKNNLLLYKTGAFMGKKTDGNENAGIIPPKIIAVTFSNRPKDSTKKKAIIAFCINGSYWDNKEKFIATCKRSDIVFKESILLVGDIGYRWNLDKDRLVAEKKTAEAEKIFDDWLEKNNFLIQNGQLYLQENNQLSLVAKHLKVIRCGELYRDQNSKPYLTKANDLYFNPSHSSEELFLSAHNKFKQGIDNTINETEQRMNENKKIKYNVQSCMIEEHALIAYLAHKEQIDFFCYDGVMQPQSLAATRLCLLDQLDQNLIQFIGITYGNKKSKATDKNEVKKKHQSIDNKKMGTEKLMVLNSEEFQNALRTLKQNLTKEITEVLRKERQDITNELKKEINKSDKKLNSIQDDINTNFNKPRLYDDALSFFASKLNSVCSCFYSMCGEMKPKI